MTSDVVSARKKHAKFNDDIPDDILHDHILPRLPVKSLLRLRLVCRSWQTLISNPTFTKSHLTHSSTNPNNHILLLHSQIHEYDEITRVSHDLFEKSLVRDVIEPKKDLRLVGSINGLVCVEITLHKHPRWDVSINDDGRSDIIFYVWNPATKQSLSVPYKFVRGRKTWCSGFGFDPMTNDYKIICIKDNVSNEQGDIYSCNSDSWRQVGMHNSVFFNLKYWSVNVEGCPYWICEDHTAFGRIGERIRRLSGVKFYVEKDAFIMVPPLDLVTLFHSEETGWRVVNLKDVLSVLVYNYKTASMDVYGLDERCLSGGVWSCLHTVGPIPYWNTFPWQCFKNGEVLFGTRLTWLLYNPKSDIVKCLCDRSSQYQSGFAYIESLVSLKRMKSCLQLKFLNENIV